MTAFYRHLLAGNSYPQALRLAKLDAIEQGVVPLDWAGIVLMGS
ncbi:MAG: CHAT domain-containing protein [Bacteroidota bacterium]